MSVIYKVCEEILNEESFNTIIKQCQDLNVLNELFAVKLSYIEEKTHSPVLYDIKAVLENINSSNCIVGCEVLFKALSVQCDDSQFLFLLNYVAHKIDSCGQPETDITLYLLETLLKVCEINNRTVEFENRCLSLFKKCTEKLRYYFLIKILPKSKFFAASTLFEISLLNVILEENNLSLLCVLMEIVIIEKSDCAFKTVCDQPEFWSVIQNSLNDGPLNQKHGIYLLKQITTANIVFRKYAYIESEAWGNFLMLLDTAREKQLHLLKPSLQLLKSVFLLDDEWVVCLHRILFLHSQKYVQFYAVQNILKDEWVKDVKNFSAIVSYMLPVFNKMENADVLSVTLNCLCNFVSTCDKELLTILLNESCKILWSPVAAWLFYKNIFMECLCIEVEIAAFEKVLTSLFRIPNKYIRIGCIRYIMKYVSVRFQRDALLHLLLFVAQTDLKLLDEVFDSTYFSKNTENKMLPSEQLNKANLPTQIALSILIINCASSILKTKASEEVEDNCVRTGLAYASNCLDNVKDADNLENILYALEKLFKFYCHNDSFSLYKQELIEKSKEILLDKNKYNNRQIELAIKIFLQLSFTDKNISSMWIANFRNEYKNMPPIIFTFCFELYVHQFQCQDEESFDQAYEIIENVFLSETYEKVLCILEYVPHLLSVTEKQSKMVNLLELCRTQIKKLVKTTGFIKAVELFLHALFSDTLLHEESAARSKIIEIIWELGELSKTFVPIRCLLFDKIHDFYKNSNKCCIDLARIFVELVLGGIILKKEERAEYFVHADIENEIGGTSQISKEYMIRIKAWDVLNHVTDTCEQEIFINVFLERYKSNLNKRYFPDSLIHLEKLRIVQFLLILQDTCSQQKRLELRNFFIESLCTESHQPSVKQLIQLLLIRLFEDAEDSLQIIVNTLDTASRTHVSTITAFIPVLYHVTLSKDEEFWLGTADALLTYTMGAHFKLRVYAQFAFLKLYDQAKTKCKYEKFIKRYGMLQGPIRKVLAATGSQKNDVLQTDEQFFEIFDPYLHYCFETIFVLIPMLNKVTVTEWEGYMRNVSHIMTTKYSEEPLNLWNKDNIFKEMIEEYWNLNKITSISENLDEAASNIQRKITPWKPGLEVQTANDNFILIASLVDKLANLGGLSRTCEVFGLKQFVLNDAKILDNKEFKSLSMCSESWLHINEVKIKDLQQFLFHIKDNGYTIVGAEQTMESVPLNTFKFTRKTALLLGNEKEGIPPNLLPLLDVCVEIPQSGVTRSLNVHVAGATFIWEYMKQHFYSA